VNRFLSVNNMKITAFKRLFWSSESCVADFFSHFVAASLQTKIAEKIIHTASHWDIWCVERFCSWSSCLNTSSSATATISSVCARMIWHCGGCGRRSVRPCECWVYGDTTMKTLINHVLSSCSSALRQTHTIKRSLPSHALNIFITSLYTADWTVLWNDALFLFLLYNICVIL